MIDFGFLGVHEPVEPKKLPPEELFLEQGSYDPCPGQPGHENWVHVLTAAYAVSGSDYRMYNIFALLREQGVQIIKSTQNRVVKFELGRGAIESSEMTRLAKEYLTPNREAVHRVLSLAAFEGRVVE